MPRRNFGKQVRADVRAILWRMHASLPPELEDILEDAVEPVTVPPRKRREDTTEPVESSPPPRSRPSGMPTRGRVSSAYGERIHPILKVKKAHKGEDIAAPIGTPVVATADGKVVYAAARGTFGLLVEIDHGEGYRTRYAHLSRITMGVGQKVRRGDLLGEVGMTGRATGPHLHYEIIHNGRHIDPKTSMAVA